MQILKSWCALWVTDAYSVLCCGMMLGMLVAGAMFCSSAGMSVLAAVFSFLAVVVVPVAYALVANVKQALKKCANGIKVE